MLDLAGDLPDKQMITVLAALGRLWRDDEPLARTAVQRLLRVTDPDLTMTGLAALHGGALTTADLAAFRPAASQWLRARARQTRDELLRETAERAPVLVSLGSEQSALTMARTVHEVCRQWSWP
jgi:hypothetical protein